LIALKLFQKNPKLVWLLAHCVLNLIYVTFIILEGRLFGESNAIAFDSNTPVIFIVVLLFLSFAYFNIFLFNISLKFPIIPIKFKPDEATGGRIGLLILFLQILYFIYFLISGVGVAGSTTKDQSILSQIWVLIPVDVLFLLFYSTYRDSKYLYLNLIVNLISNFIRGWSGVVLTVIFIESCILIRQKKLSSIKLFYYMALVIFLYPFLYYGKIFIRLYGSSVDPSASNFLDAIFSFDFISLLQGSFFQIGDRIQLISSAISTYEISNQLNDLISIGSVAPFWHEGIHALAWERLFSESPKQDVGKAIANILDPFSVEVNWNSNPTFIGWFFIMPLLSLFNILYISMLVLVSSIVMRTISMHEVTKDLLWYMVLVLVIPGWYGGYILFVYACLLFFLIHIILNVKIKRISNFARR
jgi:hypothetical protein